MPRFHVFGLILALLGPAALSAQAPQRWEKPAAPWDHSPRREGDVVPAAFETPVPASNPARPAAGPAAVPQGKATDARPLPAPPREGSLPLAPPGSTAAADSAKRAKGLPPVLTVVSSLAVVLGVFFVLVWLVRRTGPKGMAPLPTEVFEVLGRAPLSGRQQVHMLRCGSKLLLVSVTPAGAETLTEITDPVEVDRLAGLCQQTRPNSATAVFRQVFQQFGRQDGSRGLGAEDHEARRRSEAGIRGGDIDSEDRHG